MSFTASALALCDADRFVDAAVKSTGTVGLVCGADVCAVAAGEVLSTGVDRDESARRERAEALACNDDAGKGTADTSTRRDARNNRVQLRCCTRAGRCG